MKLKDKVFSGRIIFDHLAKTAGQSLNAWLVETMGSGCVTYNLNGTHRNLIQQYGGQFSVIFAHVSFQESEDLDPRYQYVTLLREPLDRAVSWLYYVLNDVKENDGAFAFKKGAKQFIDSLGSETTPEFLGSIYNPYTSHFSHSRYIVLENDINNYSKAISQIKEYELIGFYNEMAEFTDDIAALLKIPAPKTIGRINVTSSRPTVNSLPQELLQRIIDLNQLDIQFYNEVVDWKKSQHTKKRKIITISPWKKYEPLLDRVFTTPDILEVRAVLREGCDVMQGQVITFDVDFTLNRQVRELEADIHVFDEYRRLAFGTNSTLQAKRLTNISIGFHQITYYLATNLPSGEYTAGFAFTELLPEGGQKELAWYDVLCNFKVCHASRLRSVGYAEMPAEINLVKMGNSYRFDGSNNLLQTIVGQRYNTNILTTGQAGWLIHGPYITLPAGKYRVIIHGIVGVGGLAGARMDVAVDSGTKVIAEFSLQSPNIGDVLVSVHLHFDSVCNKMEVRVWVESGSDISISMIEIATYAP